MKDHTLMVYFQEIPQTVKVGADTYIFMVKANVSACWIKDEHVGVILGITKTCCGGNRSHPYHIANEMQINHWTGLRGG